MNVPGREIRIPLPGLGAVLLAAVGLAIGWMLWEAAQTQRAEDELARRREALFDPESSLRERSRSMDLWVQDGRRAVPQLVRETRNRSPQVRAAAVTALARIRPLEEDALAVILELLDDADADVRLASVDALRHLGDRGNLDLRPHLPRFVRMLDDVESVRREVLLIVRDARTGRPERGDLIRLTASSRPATRALAVRLIREFELNDHLSISAVCSLLDDADATVQDEAFRTLIAHGGTTLGHVQRALGSENEEVRVLACRALESFGSAAAPATERLRARLRSAIDTEAVSVLNALAAIGTSAEAAVPDVMQFIELYNDEGFNQAAYRGRRLRLSPGLVGGAALRCLARISTDEELVASTLRRAMFSRDRFACRFAGEALREFSPELARESVPPLLAALAERDGAGKAAALTALGGLGPEASAAFPAVLELVGDPTPAGSGPGVGYYAVEALGGMEMAEAVPVLEDMLETITSGGQTEPRVEVVARALFRIGVRSEAAEDALCRFVEQHLPVLDEGANLWNLSAATLALARVSVDSDKAHDTICRLLEKLEDSGVARPFGRDHAYWALADLGARPERTVTLLLRAAREHGDSGGTDQHGPVRHAPDAPTFDSRVRLIAIRGLGLFPQCADRSVPVLIEILQEGTRGSQIVAALALGELGDQARDAVPALRKQAGVPVPGAGNRLSWAARGYSLSATDVVADYLPDLVSQFTYRLSTLSLPEAARFALERIESPETAVFAPHPR